LWMEYGWWILPLKARQPARFEQNDDHHQTLAITCVRNVFLALTLRKRLYSNFRRVNSTSRRDHQNSPGTIYDEYWIVYINERLDNINSTKISPRIMDRSAYYKMNFACYQYCRIL
jgi:hypothetical protein